MCQRYYQFAMPSSGPASGAVNFLTSISHQTQMRASATYTLEGSLTITDGGANFTQTGSDQTVSWQNTSGAGLNLSGFSGLTSSSAYAPGSGTRITCAAEL